MEMLVKLVKLVKPAPDIKLREAVGRNSLKFILDVGTDFVEVVAADSVTGFSSKNFTFVS